MKRVLLLALVSVSAFAVPVDFTSVSIDPAYTLGGWTQTPEGLFTPGITSPPNIRFAAEVQDVEVSGNSSARVTFVGFKGSDFVFQREVDPDAFGNWSIALYWGTLGFDRIVVGSMEPLTVSSMDYSYDPVPGRPDVVPDGGSTALLLAGSIFSIVAFRRRH
jgi:hypothetical protein